MMINYRNKETAKDIEYKAIISIRLSYVEKPLGEFIEILRRKPNMISDTEVKTLLSLNILKILRKP